MLATSVLSLWPLPMSCGHPVKASSTPLAEPNLRVLMGCTVAPAEGWGVSLWVAKKRLGRGHNWVCSAVMAAHCPTLCRTRTAPQTLKCAAEVQSWGDEGGKIRGRLNYVSLTHLGAPWVPSLPTSLLLLGLVRRRLVVGCRPPWCLHYSVLPNSWHRPPGLLLMCTAPSQGHPSGFESLVALKKMPPVLFYQFCLKCYS